MKIRLVAIQPDDMAEITRLTGDIRVAVKKGDMDEVDAVTEKLMALTANMRSIDITEKEWRDFLSKVRARNPGFQSDYLISVELCRQFFPDANADVIVLQLPFSEQEGDNV